jgi:SAM-dependent methyltransferase
MSTKGPYSEGFFEVLQRGARNSAREIVPLILELFQPHSIVDVGCGDGTWLSVFKEFGAQECFGIDGNYLDEKILKIPKQQFLPFDLKRPLQIERQFDLVVSLEVAEHIPGEQADIFVDSLTGLGKVILFSAAIPFQGGVDHVNEQWQGYWSKKFQKRGYVTIDYIRKKVWQNENVEFWYAQNILIFVDKNHLENHHSLKKEFEDTVNFQLSLVHPKKYIQLVEQYMSVVEKYLAATEAAKCYAAAADPRNMSLRGLLQALPIVAINGLKRTTQGVFGKRKN